MAIKTFINGQENGVITFKGDTEPCSLYVNGEKQDNLSYYGVDVTGENSVTYESEYKKNIRTMQAEGNTYQAQYGGYQLLELKDSSGSKTDSDGNVLSWEIKDGIVTVNGTSNVFTVLSLDYRNFNAITYKAGTYTYTPYYYRELGDIGMTGCDWKFKDVYYDTYIAGYTANNKGVATLTFDHDFKLVHIQLYIKSNVQYDNFKYTPAILKGTYAALADLPPYEPYVGGIPSPNPGQTYEVQNEVESLNAKDYTYYSSDDYIYVTQEPIALTEGISYEIDAQYAGAGTPPSDFTLGVAPTREDFFASQGNPLNVTWLITNGTPTGNKPVLEPPFYIGVGSTNTPVTDKDVYINALYDYFIVFFNSYSKVTIPAYPQPIENANDNGMSLVNNGLNLFDQEVTLTGGNFTKAEYEGFECIKVRPTASVRAFPCFIPKGSFSVNLQYISPKGVSFSIFMVYEDGTKLYTFENSITQPMTEFRNSKVTRTATQNIVGFEFRFYNIGTYNEYYFKDIMVNVGQPMDYLPYFRNEIPIPASVTKADGTVVDLRMGKISTTFGANEYVAIDYLTVDRLANKVLYHQNIEKATLTKDKNWGIYTYNGKQFLFCRDNLGAKRNYNPILADKYFGYATMGAMLQQDYGITTDAVWWGVDYRLSLRDIRFDNVDDFKANLEQNPIEIEYGLAEEITHDITDTDLGQALLNLATQNQQNTITITSQPSISALNVNYAKWGGTINANTNT